MIKIALFQNEDQLPYFSFFLENVSAHIQEELNANSIFPTLIRLFLPVSYDDSTNTVTVRHYVKPEERENPYFTGALDDKKIELTNLPRDLISSSRGNSDIFLFADNYFSGVIQLCREDLTDSQKREFIRRIIPRLNRSFVKLSEQCQKTLEEDKKLTVLQYYFREIIRKIDEKIKEIMPPTSIMTYPPWIEINYGIWKPKVPTKEEPPEVVLQVIPHPDQKNYIEWLNAFLVEFAKEGFFKEKYESYLKDNFYERFSGFSWGLSDPVQAPGLLFKAYQAEAPQISYSHDWEKHIYVYGREYEERYGLEKLIFKNSQSFFLIAYPKVVVVAIVTRKGELNIPDQERHQKKIEKELQKQGHIRALEEILHQILIGRVGRDTMAPYWRSTFQKTVEEK